jgi:2-amino-4-hydroxy-6-hydroxymethyldihydropteridine diphosphokinase
MERLGGTMTVAAIGLGANLSNPAENISKAIVEIAKLGRPLAVSGLYQSRAWGYEEQPDFYNAAMLIDVDLSAPELLLALQSIEASLGRTPTFKWGPRVIDLDLLFFGDEKIQTPTLVVPHPFMNERAFVLKPLAEIDSSFKDALAKLPADSVSGCTKLRPLDALLLNSSPRSAHSDEDSHQ